MRNRSNIPQTSPQSVRMMSWDQGAAYTGLGRTMFRSWAREIGATKKIGRRLLFDRNIIDQYLNEMPSERQASPAAD